MDAEIVRLELTIEDAESLGSSDPTVRAYLDMQVYKAIIARSEAVVREAEDILRFGGAS